MSASVPVFYGYVNARGDVKLEDRSAFLAHAATLKGWDIEISIRKKRHKRSTPANARYWALVTVAARELGYDDPEDLHEGVALKFLALPEVAPGVPRRRRTPDLDTAEFAEYTDKVERFFLIDLHLDLTGWQDEAERRTA